jgi:hypothetical protein
MSVRVVALAASLALLAGGAPARAAGPRLLIDRAEAEPSPFSGLARLRLHVSAVQLEGSLIEAGGGELTLLLNGARRREPHLTGRYAASGGATAVILVIETGWELRDDVDPIQAAMAQLVAKLPPGSQVAVITYGENVEGGHRLLPSAKVDNLEPDMAPADPQLLTAVDRAITTLSRAKAPDAAVPLRRMIVVVSDGKDQDPEPERYRAVGQRAMKEEVRIHSLAYSPVDNRRPLVGLGELSKRSGGTFRWVRSREGFAPQIDTLVAEINQQYVLTWFLPADDLVNKRVAVSFRELSSNEVRIKKVECGGKTCAGGELCARSRCLTIAGGGGRGFFGWLLLVGGIVVAGALVLGVIGSLMIRARGRTGGAGGGVPGAAAPGVPPGAPHIPVGPAPNVASSATLFVTQGPFQGQRMPLRHGFLVGSARGADLFLPGDPGVAPHHAVFVIDATGIWAVIDRSQMGVFVNGVRVAEARLQHGNLIRIGTCELRYLGG